MTALIPRHRLDIGLDDLAFAATACVRTSAQSTAARAVEELAGQQAIACLSVRSAFDLFLTAIALPKGSEVLVSALTIPDMARVIREHGLVPVPVDLDLSTLAPAAGALQSALSPCTRAVLVAHLFGGDVDLTPICEFARRHGLLLIEDAAQGFKGPAHRGDVRADLSLFSFGTIKTSTALGGALAFVREPKLLERMRQLQSQWPVQATGSYAKKIGTICAFAAARGPTGYGALADGCAATGVDFDALLLRATRGFPNTSALFTGIRRRPCAALLTLLLRRLVRFDSDRLMRRSLAGEALLRRLRPAVDVLGSDQPQRTHWLFAITVDAPDAVVSKLRRLGFDASRGATSIGAVPAPHESGHEPARNCVRAMERVVFLPAYPEIDECDRARLADALVAFAADPEQSRSSAAVATCCACAADPEQSRSSAAVAT